MEQLILHLFGDYVTQSQWMADNKSKAWWPAFAHALVYSLPFLLIMQRPPPHGALFPTAFAVILWSHFLIDRYRLARYVVYLKNILFNWGSPGPRARLPWSDCNATGYPNTMPPWLSVWLLIAADNTLHLTINYLALRYL